MSKKQIQLITSEETIVNKIYFIRGQKVMLDKDLAGLYGVLTGNLNKAVKRNLNRFPAHYMFQLTREEYNALRFQFGILKKGQHAKYLPHAFTEHGILQLANVLQSDRATQMSIRIIDVFIKMREMLSSHKDILLKLEQLEKKFITQDSKNNKYEEQIQLLFSYLKELLNPVRPPRNKIGYKQL